MPTKNKNAGIKKIPVASNWKRMTMPERMSSSRELFRLTVFNSYI